MIIKNIVIIVVLFGDNVLLGYRRRGRAINLLDTFSGKIENGETSQETAKRELKEESGLEATDITKMGNLRFNFLDESLVLNADIFLVKSFIGREMETSEMLPVWHSAHSIPYEQCWPNLRVWLPKIFDNEMISGTFEV